jgi:tetratricopeptide (TPR) repeat protein
MVKNEFDLGNLFFNELNRPDSASYYYSDILNNYPGSRYEARTLYSLGIYYETLNDSVKSDSLFNIIYDRYRSEKVVNAVAIKLKKPIVDFEFDPAKNLYADAETDLLKKNFDVSLNKFYGISEKYPKSPLAAKALFASGWILENDLKLYDSAAVIYDTLTTRYPKSVYAGNVKPKLYYYKEEIKRKILAVQDSLRKIEQDKIKKNSLDSLSSLRSQNNGQKDSVHINNKKMGIDSLNNPKGIMNDSLRNIRNKFIIDSLNNKRRVMNDSLQRFNNKMSTDSLNNNKKIIIDSLKKRM